MTRLHKNDLSTPLNPCSNLRQPSQCPLFTETHIHHQGNRTGKTISSNNAVKVTVFANLLENVLNTG